MGEYTIRHIFASMRYSVLSDKDEQDEGISKRVSCQSKVFDGTDLWKRYVVNP